MGDPSPPPRVSLERVRASRGAGETPRSGKRRVRHDVGGDPQGALIGVPFAVEPLLPFEGTAQVVLRVDDGPVAVELDPFELGEVATAPRGLAVLDVGEVEPDLVGVDLVV